MKKIVPFILCLFIVGCSSSDNSSGQTEKTENITVNNTEKNIFETVQVEASWEFNIQDPNLVIDDATYVAKVKIVGVDDVGEFVGDGIMMPRTAVHVEVLETLKGVDMGAVTTIYYWGGFVTVQDVIDISPEGRINKYGWDTLTEDEKNQYVYYEMDGIFDFQMGQEYIVALSQDYYVAANGYSIFVENKRARTSSIEFENVLTQEKVSVDEIIAE